MKHLRLLSWSSCLMWMLVLASCHTSAYEQTVRAELNSGIRYDSLFLGFRFGETRKTFFDKGWKLNKQGLVMQGPENKNVQYRISAADSTQFPIRFLFYPHFDGNDKIKEMRVAFDYEGWSPWSARFGSDSLLVAVKDTLMNWYGGNPFVLVEPKNEGDKPLWAKVDGNRRVVIYKKNERVVAGKISDLLHDDILDKNKLK
ncbi:hypothetical protein [Marinoscillum furvescens]|uniref:Lipoprotein n=1 Tax=Marinoscillum furvescens DSM 4134 TaxID=1122208 RepID=A0A3D9L637_MARFU|nr:hypothetical protein [Marinoscillum furvescens]REE01564.1 hypothetical protein C7460_10380 [Marinoscillum furvescens DSM 4134]